MLRTYDRPVKVQRSEDVNVGEEICGEWLQHIKGCEFVQYNLKTTDVQGEIDVIGINLKENIVYTCEVAVHLITGLQYVKNRRPDNVPRLIKKFQKDIEYIQSAFPNHRHVFMLWSPIVKNQKKGSKYNQIADIAKITATIKQEYDVPIEAIVNERFQQTLDELRSYAQKETKELDSTVMRYLQVEEHLAKHIQRLSAQSSE